MPHRRGRATLRRKPALPRRGGSPPSSPPRPIDYVVVASAPLEDPDLPAILRALRRLPGHAGDPANREPRALLAPQREPRRLPRPAGLAGRGFARLEEHGLSFDLQLNPQPVPQGHASCRAVTPGIPIIVGHLGSPTLDDLREGTVYWDGPRGPRRSRARASQDLDAVLPGQASGTRNPLVRDSVSPRHRDYSARADACSRRTSRSRSGWDGRPSALYAAFRELVSHLDADERQRLFADSARRAYRAPDSSAGVTIDARSASPDTWIRVPFHPGRIRTPAPSRGPASDQRWGEMQCE